MSVLTYLLIYLKYFRPRISVMQKQWTLDTRHRKVWHCVRIRWAVYTVFDIFERKHQYKHTFIHWRKYGSKRFMKRRTDTLKCSTKLKMKSKMQLAVFYRKVDLLVTIYIYTDIVTWPWLLTFRFQNCTNSYRCHLENSVSELEASARQYIHCTDRRAATLNAPTWIEHLAVSLRYPSFLLTHRARWTQANCWRRFNNET